MDVTYQEAREQDNVKEGRVRNFRTTFPFVAVCVNSFTPPPSYRPFDPAYPAKAALLRSLWIHVPFLSTTLDLLDPQFLLLSAPVVVRMIKVKVLIKVPLREDKFPSDWLPLNAGPPKGFSKNFPGVISKHSAKCPSVAFGPSLWAQDATLIQTLTSELFQVDWTLLSLSTCL